MFLCRNYALGDNVFGFGFSRGAFTIRVLARFVLAKGLITEFDSGDDLRRKARKLYRSFRAEQSKEFFLSHLVQSFIYLCLQPFEPNVGSTRAVSRIAFIGVWDTVDAYGMPIEELKVGIDRYIWPLAIRDRYLDAKIQKACHALSIDDARTSFHPLLWDESETLSNRSCKHTAEEQLTQIWFAGVHSNVGGGYPDDGLAHVSLRWMVREAAAKGLIFNPKVIEEIESRVAPFGKLYNSRGGLGAYYRYGPRWLAPAIDKQDACIPHLKVHESVIWRMAAGTDEYAPLNLPGDFQIVLDDARWADLPRPGRINEGKLSGAMNIYDFAEYQRSLQKDARLFGVAAGSPADDDLKERIAANIRELQTPDKSALDLTADTVWWRQVVYFAAVVTTASLLLYPKLPRIVVPDLLWDVISDVIPFPLRWKTSAQAVVSAIGTVLQPIVINAVDLVSPFAPSFIAPWLESYRESPWGVVWLGIVVAMLLIWGSALDRRIHDRALSAWKGNWRASRAIWLLRTTRMRFVSGVLMAFIAGGYLLLWLTDVVRFTVFWINLNPESRQHFFDSYGTLSVVYFS